MSDSLAKPTVKDDNISKCVEKLFEEILAPNTDEGIGTDNMTCILIKLYNGPEVKEWTI
jgi:serine/threonine protein phosphatase PrpC